MIDSIDFHSWIPPNPRLSDLLQPSKGLLYGLGKSHSHDVCVSFVLLLSSWYYKPTFVPISILSYLSDPLSLLHLFILILSLY